MTRNVKVAPTRRGTGLPAVKALAEQQVPRRLGRVGGDTRCVQAADAR